MKKLKIIVISAILFFCFQFFTFGQTPFWKLEKDSMTLKFKNLVIQNDMFVIDSIVSYFENGNIINLTYKYNDNGKYTSELVEIGDDSISSISSRKTYDYDINNNLLFCLSENFINSEWVNNFRETNAYDSIGKKISFIREEWEHNKWQVSEIKTYIYDTNGMISIYQQQVNEGSNTYIYEDTYTYDSLGNVINYSHFKYQEKILLGSIQNSYSYIYDSSGNILTKIIKYNGIIQYRNTYSYNEKGLIKSILYEDYINGEFIITGRISYEYDSKFNIITLLSEHYENNDFSYDEMTKYFYNLDDKLVMYMNQSWNGTDWINNNRLSFQYNENKQLVEIYTESGNHQTWIPSDCSLLFSDSLNNDFYHRGYKSIIKWSLLTGFDDRLNFVSCSTNVSPNPFPESTTIHYYLDIPAFVSINVYNSYGIKNCNSVNENQDSGEQQFVFDGRNYPPGLYFYTIQIGDKILNGKMVLIK